MGGAYARVRAGGVQQGCLGVRSRDNARARVGGDGRTCARARVCACVGAPA